MRAVFRYLYENGVRPDQLLETIGEIPLHDGMREWLQVSFPPVYLMVEASLRVRLVNASYLEGI